MNYDPGYSPYESPDEDDDYQPPGDGTVGGQMDQMTLDQMPRKRSFWSLHLPAGELIDVECPRLAVITITNACLGSTGGGKRKRCRVVGSSKSQDTAFNLCDLKEGENENAKLNLTVNGDLSLCATASDVHLTGSLEAVDLQLVQSMMSGQGEEEDDEDEVPGYLSYPHQDLQDLNKRWQVGPYTPPGALKVKPNRCVKFKPGKQLRSVKIIPRANRGVKV